METYLMMLYVSLEQEKALKQFFQDNGWPFCKPDLSKTTDIIGPLSPTLPQIPKDQGNGEKGTVPGQPQHKDVNVMQDVEDTVPLETIVEIRGDNNTVTLHMDADIAEHLRTSGALMQIAQHILKNQTSAKHVAIRRSKVKAVGDKKHEPITSTLESMNLYSETDLHDVPNDTARGHESQIEITSSRNIADDVAVANNQISHDLNSFDKGAKVSYKCCQCHKTYSHQSSLIKHKKSHTLNFKHCASCNQYFDTETDLSKHNKRCHQEMQICALCSATFSRKTSLRKHMVKRHQEVAMAQYKCQVPSCPCAFTYKKQLDDHMNIHNGNKPYKCNVCQKAFPLFVSLKNHEANHAKDGKRFKCSQCDAVFQGQGSLSSHKAVHNRQIFRCHCGKVFRNCSLLARHRDTHSRTRGTAMPVEDDPKQFSPSMVVGEQTPDSRLQSSQSQAWPVQAVSEEEHTYSGTEKVAIFTSDETTMADANASVYPFDQTEKR